MTSGWGTARSAGAAAGRIPARWPAVPSADRPYNSYPASAYGGVGEETGGLDPFPVRSGSLSLSTVDVSGLHGPGGRRWFASGLSGLLGKNPDTAIRTQEKAPLPAAGPTCGPPWRPGMPPSSEGRGDRGAR